METLNLKILKLTANESKAIIKLIAKKRSTTTKKILETINQNQKRRINKKQTKTTTKTNRNTTKTNKNTTKTKKKSQKSQQKNTIN